MNRKKFITGIGLGIIAFAIVFVWLFWGTDIPDKQVKGTRPKSATPVVTDTVLTREADGKTAWKFTVKEAETRDQNNIVMRGIEGDVYMSDGDVMHVTAQNGEAHVKENKFTLKGNVTAKMQKNSGFLRADRLMYNKKEDILTAMGKVKIIKDNHLAMGDEAETNGKFTHFKLKGNAYLERGGKYEEK